MNIAYVVPGLGLSGGTNVILEYASGLSKRGHQVFLLNCDNSASDLSWHPITDVVILDLHDIPSLRFA
ncbi:MAG TPA: hypothetical protein VHW66_13765, partial [Stellaceae bacterium]|nr:hypothetical protein [Stellaceae bacterium]